MVLVRMRRPRAARSLGCAAAFVLVAASLGLPSAWAQQKATITGVILDPAGVPQPGCQIVIRDLSSGMEFRSARTGADGTYSVDVPVGPRYAFLSVVDPGGGVHPLDLTPLAVTLPARLTRNIRLVPAAAPAPTKPERAPSAVPPSPGATSPVRSEEEKKKKKGAPWWRTNGKWVGVGVGVVIAGIALGNDDDEPASPSEP